MANNDKISVLFVCLGNICRSPIAGALFKHLVKERGLEERFDRIESAGTASYHVGSEPDSRSVDICRKHKVPINSRAQQAEPKHFDQFDYIFAMDSQNLRNLQRIQPKNSKAKLAMLGPKPVPDPYYESGGFESTFEMIQGFLNTRLDEIIA